MSSDITMARLFDKLNDLKSVFIYSEKLIPVIQSIIDFMRDTVPLLENINHSISDSTAKIPKVSNQINNVTNATELATNEILDLIDKMLNETSQSELLLEKLIELEKQKEEILIEVAKQSTSPRAQDLLSNYEKYNDIPRLEMLLAYVKNTKEYANNITISLQVQDITAQQLAAVNHLIESVQKKLTSLIINIENSHIKTIDDLSIPFEANMTFDPNARYQNNESSQKVIDEIIEKKNSTTDQEQIDKLFLQQ
jgi:chemotaxis regulatin CheY-phosphate phosphatase CheZ